MREWINKFLHIHPMECHSAIKINELLDIYNNKDDSQRHYAERKKPVSKSFILHDSIYITFGKRQNYSYRNSSCRSLGMGEVLTTKGQHKEIFWIFYILYIDLWGWLNKAWHKVCVKTHSTVLQKWKCYCTLFFK